MPTAEPILVREFLVESALGNGLKGSLKNAHLRGYGYLLRSQRVGDELRTAVPCRVPGIGEGRPKRWEVSEKYVQQSFNLLRAGCG